MGSVIFSTSTLDQTSHEKYYVDRFRGHLKAFVQKSTDTIRVACFLSFSLSVWLCLMKEAFVLLLFGFHVPLARRLRTGRVLEACAMSHFGGKYRLREPELDVVLCV